MKTFSAMWSDKLGVAINEASKEPYPMEFHLRTKQLEAVANAINQGIDSHLETVEFTQDNGSQGRTRITLAPKSVSVLVRRLMESGNDEALNLASAICSTLNIELI